jgi:hypothetical protein
MTIKNNLKATVLNLLGAATGIVRVTSEVTLEASTIATNSVGGFMPAVSALIKTPVSAYAGYIQEDRNITEEAADAIAAAIFDKTVAQAIERGSRESGRLISVAFSDWDVEEVATKATK